MKYIKKEEEVISNDIGYPYNILPSGYPNKISTKLINHTIEKILSNLKANAGVETIISRDYVLINLGLNELNNRQSKIESRIAFLLSIFSLVLATLALLI